MTLQASTNLLCYLEGMHPEKIIVWCQSCAGSVIGPYFFGTTLASTIGQLLPLFVAWIRWHMVSTIRHSVTYYIKYTALEIWRLCYHSWMLSHSGVMWTGQWDDAIWYHYIFTSKQQSMAKLKADIIIIIDQI